MRTMRREKVPHQLLRSYTNYMTISNQPQDYLVIQIPKQEGIVGWRRRLGLQHREEVVDDIRSGDARDISCTTNGVQINSVEKETVLTVVVGWRDFDYIRTSGVGHKIENNGEVAVERTRTRS